MVTDGTVVNLNEASGAEITSGTGNIVWYSDSGCADVVSDPTSVTYTGNSDKYYYAKAVGDCSSDPKSFKISACYASYDGSTYLYFDINNSYFKSDGRRWRRYVLPAPVALTACLRRTAV